MRRARALFLLSSLTLVCSTSAYGFECTAVPSSGVTQVWQSRCIPYAISCRSDLLLGSEMRSLVARSFARWEEVSCSDLRFLEVGYTTETEGFLLSKPSEQRNVIAALDVDSDLEIFPDPRLLALTFTHFAVDTGEILDADIVLNASQFRFEDTATGCDPKGDAFDFENTLVHEIGHLIGFDHVTDPEATMYASAEACEVKKRDLAADDELALCTVYPTGQPASTCEQPSGGYDSAGLDLPKFRDQCDHFADPGSMMDEAACVEARGTGGCGCSSTQTGSDGRIALLLCLLGVWWSSRRALSGK